MARKLTGRGQPRRGTREHTGTAPSRASLSTRLRSAPLGILLIATLLVIMAGGSVVGGVYLLADQGSVSWWAAAMGLMGGPAILYLTWHILRLDRWTWIALLVFTGLMAVSSVVRLLVSDALPIAPAGELLVEAIIAVYLTRPGVRSRFGAEPPASDH